MSNRHWEFVNDKLLAPLNDKLAVRHGAQYTFKVPEGSFDWDVEFAAVKDRRGNKIKELYLSAWCQPSLVGPDENTVHQLGQKLVWEKGMKGFSKDDQTTLMAAVDQLLGSPLKKEKDEEDEDETENKKAPPENKVIKNKNDEVSSKAASIAKMLIADNEMADETIKLLQHAADSLSLSSNTLLQVETDDMMKKINDFKKKDSSIIYGFIVELLVNMIRNGHYQEDELHGALSKLKETLDKALLTMKSSSSEKLKSNNDIENAILSLYDFFGVTHEGTTDLQDTLRGVKYTDLVKSVQTTLERLEALKEKLPEIIVEDLSSSNEPAMPTETQPSFVQPEA